MPKFRQVALGALVVLGMASAVSSQPMKDAPGVKDPALFTRMPNFFLRRQLDAQESPFDVYTFTVQVDKRLEKVRVEGRKGVYQYNFDPSSGAPKPSPLASTLRSPSAVRCLGTSRPPIPRPVYGGRKSRLN